MSDPFTPSCGCGPPPHPRTPDIPAGQPDLGERQLAGFPDYRAAMLNDIGLHAALSDWRARGDGDLGVMLIEAFAYVLDITGFYDARIAERSYLQTAPDAASAQRLTHLLGHRPRPAMAASVTLAVKADGADPVVLPKGTAFRSAAFGDEPPQVFELASATTIWPERNEWSLAPVRDTAFDGVLRFRPRRAPNTGALLHLQAGAITAAIRILALNPETGPDGGRYLRADYEPAGALTALIGQDRSGIALNALGLPLAETGITIANPLQAGWLADAAGTTVVRLDARYPQARKGQPVIVEVGAALHAATITETADEDHVVKVIDADTSITQTLTAVRVDKSIARTSGDGLRMHVNAFGLGRPSRIAKTEINLADLQASGALEAPSVLGPAPAGGDVVAVGARSKGARLSGQMIEEGDGAMRFQPGGGAAAFDPLATPVRLHGNVLTAVRGETVIDEVLGNGDPAKPFNSFQLKKTPLAWVEDASLPDGRRPELTVRVDGVEWRRVDTFFGRAPGERIYVVDTLENGAARIRFGDGARGARPPAGVGNIRADYRHGAGATKPPPGAVNQIARPVEGLASVLGPLPAKGGADAESADEMRRAAPDRALTLGRAVSMPDFVAMARSYPDIQNAAAAWAWDEPRQRAAIKLWTLADGAHPGAALADWLSKRAAPDLTIVVEQALPAPVSSLAITLSFVDGYDPDTVRAEARALLFDARTGLLSAGRQQIGGVLFRSVLNARLHEAPGVRGVEAVLLDGAPMPRAVAAGQGRWFDLESGTTVS